MEMERLCTNTQMQCNITCNRKVLVPKAKVSSLDDLVAELHGVFEQDSVNVEQVHQLMSSYKTHPKEWKKFAKFDRYRYTRNLVDAGNGKFNLMIICWGEGHGSAIHDHADAHCFMKVLQGSLNEVRFAWPSETMAAQNAEEEEIETQSGLQEIGRSVLRLNEVCYINDSMGLHRVENSSHMEPAVSLHLYCPPFESCSVFNQQTGQRVKCNVTFWSKFGEKRNREVQSSRAPEDN